MMDGLEKFLLAIPKNSTRLVRIKIAAASPLTVTLPDGTTVPGLAIAGLTYTASGNGVAICSEGAIPLVFPTTT